MLPEESAKPLLLDYAPAPSIAWRFARKAFRFILLGGLILAGYIWGPAIWYQARMLYWQRQCMNFKADPDTVVYDAALGSTPLPPICWPQFVDSAANVGPALSGMPQYGSLVFVGQLQTPSGEPRLVAVAFTSQLNWWAHGRLDPGMSYQVWVVKPGTLFHAPQSIDQLAGPGTTTAEAQSPPSPTFYFGQRDPADPSRFTIHYKVGGINDIVNGKIDDAGQVTLVQRAAPASMRSK